MSKVNKKYGWLPDLPDQRDFKFTSIFSKKLPKICKNDKYLPSYVFSQGYLGSCTACAISTAFEYCMNKQKIKNTFAQLLKLMKKDKLLAF